MLVEIAAACEEQQSWAGMRNALYRALEIQTDRLGPAHVEVARKPAARLEVVRGDLVSVGAHLVRGDGDSGRPGQRSGRTEGVASSCSVIQIRCPRFDTELAGDTLPSAKLVATGALDPEYPKESKKY